MQGKEFFKEIQKTKTAVLHCYIEDMKQYQIIIEDLKNSKNPNKKLKKYLNSLHEKELEKLGFKKFTSNFYFFPIKFALILKADPELAKNIKLEYYKGEKKYLKDITTEDIPYYGISILNSYKIKIFFNLLNFDVLEDVELPEEIESEEEAEEYLSEDASLISIENISERIKSDILNYLMKVKILSPNNSVSVSLYENIDTHLIEFTTKPLKKKKLNKKIEKIKDFLKNYSMGDVTIKIKEIKIEKIKKGK